MPVDGTKDATGTALLTHINEENLQCKDPLYVLRFLVAV
jgi:hypothetical protein